MSNRPELEFEKGYSIIINNCEKNLYYYIDYDTRQAFPYHMRFPHIHDSFYEIMIPLDAGISHTFNGITYPLEKNDIVLVPPGVPHQSIYPQNAPPLKRIIINFMYPDNLFSMREGYAILVCEEFSCLEFHMNRDMTNWILIKIEYRRSENGTITKTDTRKWH